MRDQVKLLLPKVVREKIVIEERATKPPTRLDHFVREVERGGWGQTSKIEMIQLLDTLGHAYEVDGDWYFSVRADARFGSLSQLPEDEMLRL
ncbi:MAG TPA: hypothetical protein PLY93_15315, partial [Turneriella sp.]|nr:hypothetical protein [Turneriella sp.]